VKNPSKALNITRSFKQLDQVRAKHHTKVQILKDKALTDLIRRIDATTLDEPTTLTGLYIRPQDILRLFHQ
jgi:hypothetical protein